MRSKSINGRSLQEIKSNFQDCLEDGFKPTLACVFSSVKQDWKGVCQYLDSENIEVFGMTTCSEFTDQGITSQENAILLLDLNPQYFSISFRTIGENSLLEESKKLGNEIKSKFENPGTVLSCSNYTRAGEEIIWGLVDSLGENLKVFGGGAGDDNTLSNTFVFTNQQSSSDAILALVIDNDKVSMEGVAISGWKPLGTYHNLTHIEDNWIHTIDDEPALDMILKYTGIELDASNDTDIFKKIGFSFPLLINREKGHPVATPVMMINKENKSVLVALRIKNKDKFRFSMPPDFDVVDTVVGSSKEIKDNNLPNAEAMLIFSCAARKEVLGPLLESEIMGLRDTWGSSMAGTFCYGEFGRPPGGKVEFMGTTCSWVAIKEK